MGQVVANPDFTFTPDFSSWNISLVGSSGAAATGEVYSYTGKPVQLRRINMFSYTGERTQAKC
jgi:hypothetical protein